MKDVQFVFYAVQKSVSGFKRALKNCGYNLKFYPSKKSYLSVEFSLSKLFEIQSSKVTMKYNLKKTTNFTNQGFDFLGKIINVPK